MKRYFIKNKNTAENAIRKTANECMRTRTENQKVKLDYTTEVHVISDASCHSAHIKKYYQASINICDRTGILTTEYKTVAYCETCGYFFITEGQYADLRRKGLPLIRFAGTGKGFDELNPESPLKLMGYSVAQKDGLTKAQRQFTLKYILEKKYMPKWEILSYLNWFLRNPIAGEMAYKKWKEDRLFVAEL